MASLGIICLFVPLPDPTGTCLSLITRSDPCLSAVWEGSIWVDAESQSPPQSSGGFAVLFHFLSLTKCHQLIPPHPRCINLLGVGLRASPDVLTLFYGSPVAGAINHTLQMGKLRHRLPQLGNEKHTSAHPVAQGCFLLCDMIDISCLPRNSLFVLKHSCSNL